MNIKGKITKVALLAISGIVLVLFAVFVYVNNDLGSDQFSKIFKKNTVTKLPTNSSDGELNTYDNVNREQVSDSNTNQPQSDTEVDAIFEVEEPVDNFDDLVD